MEKICVLRKRNKLAETETKDNQKINTMAKYLLQEMPDIRKAGQRRVYPKLIAHRTLSTKDVVEGLHSYNRALSESVVEAVLTDLSDHLKRMLAMGYSVKLDGIGTFSLSLDFDDKKPTEMADDDDRMLYRKVAVKDVNYKVAPELLKQLRMDTELERHSGGVRKLRKQKFTQEERIANALKVIDRSGFITLNDYAVINEMNRTTASQELRSLCSDPSCPIDSTGRGSHKVWTRRVKD